MVAPAHLEHRRRIPIGLRTHRMAPSLTAELPKSGTGTSSCRHTQLSIVLLGRHTPLSIIMEVMLEGVLEELRAVEDHTQGALEELTQGVLEGGLEELRTVEELTQGVFR